MWTEVSLREECGLSYLTVLAPLKYYSYYEVKYVKKENNSLGENHVEGACIHLCTRQGCHWYFISVVILL